MRLLDLFCGRWGWSRAFAARGWHCFGVDLVYPPEIPANCEWGGGMDVLKLTPEWVKCMGFDFIVASSPCEEFSVHGMKMLRRRLRRTNSQSNHGPKSHSTGESAAMNKREEPL